MRKRIGIAALVLTLMLPLIALAGDQNADLIEAAKQGDTDKVRKLLGKGADVNAKDLNGRTALMEAALWRRTETVKVLLDKGADVNAKDNKEETALLATARVGLAEIVKMLLAKGADV